MSKLIILFLFPLTLNVYSQIKNGQYEGFEKINVKNSDGQWYRQNTLSIRNDSIYLYKSPIFITAKDTFYSTADYGFYYYAGLITKKDNKNYISIFMTDCDYCITEVTGDSTRFTKKYHGDTINFRIFIDNNYLKFNNVKYKYLPADSNKIFKMDFKQLFIRKEITTDFPIIEEVEVKVED